MATVKNDTNCEPSIAVECPWGKVQNSPPVSSFSSLMDEEYAKELQLEESREIDTENKEITAGVYSIYSKGFLFFTLKRRFKRIKKGFYFYIYLVVFFLIFFFEATGCF